MSEVGRLPDFVIVGAMKSATSTLFWHLDQQPEVFMAHPKETNFFTTRWSNGLEWYAGKFAQASSDQLLGEASINYTDPALAPKAAERMARMIPNARLIYVLRHPVDRIRSHYRHEVQRHREDRPLLDCIRQPGNPYVGLSSYGDCLQPYIDRFPKEQILVIRFEDLVRPPAEAWPRTLQFLSLPERAMPEEAHNVGSQNAQWTWAFAWAQRHGLLSLSKIGRLPTPIRRAGKLLFTRGDESYARRLQASQVPIPGDLLEAMWEDVARLEAWVGSPLWSPGEQMVSEATG